MKNRYYIFISIAIIIIILVIFLLPNLLRINLSRLPDLNAIDSTIKAKVLASNNIVNQFETLYPDSFTGYSTYSKPNKHQFQHGANFRKLFYGRYQLELIVFFNITADEKDVLEVGETKLKITEFTSVSYKRGTFSAMQGFNKVLSNDDWQKIVDASGDISVVVPDIKKDQPVKGFSGTGTLIKEEDLNRELRK